MIAKEALAEALRQELRIGKTSHPISAALIVTLRAAGFVVEQDWQPIETAPRDGTVIDLWFAGAWNERMTGFVWRPGWDFWHNDRTHQSYNHDPNIITHWRPLPAPPAAQEADDAK